MKLLENPRLAAMTAFLTDREVSERVISGRVEAFSCKRAGEDKKLSKKLDQQYMEELATSPGLGQSPLGPLTDATTRRLLIDLISTLNASFPDYDFSSLRPEQFTREIGADFVVRQINRHLADAVPDVLDDLWLAVEDAIQLRDCDVYSYVPDLDSDPFSQEGTLWSMNFFFFNKNLKRILYFTCLARSKPALFAPSDGIPRATEDEDSDNDDAFESDDDDFNMEPPDDDVDF